MNPMNPLHLIKSAKKLLLPESEQEELAPQLPQAALAAPRDVSETYILQPRAMKTQDFATAQERLIAKAAQIGKEVALKTRAQKSDAIVLKSFDERGIALAIAETPPAFSSAAYAIDGRIEKQLARFDEDVIDCEEGWKLASSVVRQRVEERAKLGPRRGCPAASLLLKWTAAVSINFSMAITIHDQLGGLFAALKWLIAIGFAMGYSLFLVAAILPEEEQSVKGDIK